MRLTTGLLCCMIALLSTFASANTQTNAQAGPQAGPPRGVPEPVPPFLQNHPVAAEPTTPPARTFRDRRYGISFTVPAAWNVTRKDYEVSTFHLDARNAAHNAQLRAVATISFNPHPTSTFAGALFYFSVAPHTSASQCSAEASTIRLHQVTMLEIGGVSFSHGYAEHGGICTESRDEIYTTTRRDTCYRFDAVINNFCGGDVSGVRDITVLELNSVRRRMQDILDTVKFDHE